MLLQWHLLSSLSCDGQAAHAVITSSQRPGNLNEIELIGAVLELIAAEGSYPLPTPFHIPGPCCSGWLRSLRGVDRARTQLMLHTGDSEDEDSPLEGCLVCVNCAVRSAKVDVSRVCRAATAEWVLGEVTSLRFIGHLAAPPSLTPSPSDARAIWTLRAMSNETPLSWL